MATYSGSDKRLQYLFQHGGGGSLEDLDDVEITSVEDGQGLVYDEDSGKWVNGEGGGGNANEQVLTKAEYDALTEEQKMNNTTYYINDADTWTSKEVQPVIYSTDEREIGVWIDGKPLYKKTVIIDMTNTTIYDGTTFSTGITDADYIAIVEQTFWDGRENTGSGYYASIPMFYLQNTNGMDFNFCVPIGDKTKIRAIIKKQGAEATANANRKIYVTLQYTKTSDTPGSGIYTPQGQLAVHYSTEEHVIGTWIDGKSLYEKTIFTNPTWNNNGASIPLTNEICKHTEGGVCDANGENLIPFGYAAQNEYVRCYQASNVISVYNSFVSSRSYVQITIQYTKTTD